MEDAESTLRGGAGGGEGGGEGDEGPQDVAVAERGDQPEYGDSCPSANEPRSAQLVWKPTASCAGAPGASLLPRPAPCATAQNADLRSSQSKSKSSSLGRPPLGRLLLAGLLGHRVFSSLRARRRAGVGCDGDWPRRSSDGLKEAKGSLVSLSRQRKKAKGGGCSSRGLRRPSALRCVERSPPLLPLLRLTHSQMFSAVRRQVQSTARRSFATSAAAQEHFLQATPEIFAAKALNAPRGRVVLVDFYAE